MRTSLVCLKWLEIKIIIYQPYSSTFVSQSLTSDIIHFSSFKLVFSKTNKVVIFHFEVMITNIVYILKTYFFLLYFILFSDLLCPLFMHTFWHLVICTIACFPSLKSMCSLQTKTEKRTVEDRPQDVTHIVPSMTRISPDSNPLSK